MLSVPATGAVIGLSVMSSFVSFDTDVGFSFRMAICGIVLSLTLVKVTTTSTLPAVPCGNDDNGAGCCPPAAPSCPLTTSSPMLPPAGQCYVHACPERNARARGDTRGVFHGLTRMLTWMLT